MKKIIFFITLGCSLLSFSQKKNSKQVVLQNNEIHIYTAGLDVLTLENTNTDILEVILNAESYDAQYIDILDANNLTKINFEFKGAETREVVFRKFITKRLQRANAVVKIPKRKKVIVFGENIDIISKNIDNNTAIYIDNGIVKLDTIQNNTVVKFYSGNVYATVKKINVDVTSNLGKIKVDSMYHQKKYKNLSIENSSKFTLQTVNGNVFLTSY